jgi:hypothetical protein
MAMLRGWPTTRQHRPAEGGRSAPALGGQDGATRDPLGARQALGLSRIPPARDHHDRQPHLAAAPREQTPSHPCHAIAFRDSSTTVLGIRVLLVHRYCRAMRSSSPSRQIAIEPGAVQQNALVPVGTRALPFMHARLWLRGLSF